MLVEHRETHSTPQTALLITHIRFCKIYSDDLTTAPYIRDDYGLATALYNWTPWRWASEARNTRVGPTASGLTNFLRWQK
jgi:hypothetical protein